MRKDKNYVASPIAVHAHLDYVIKPSIANLITHGLIGYAHPEILWKNVPLIFAKTATKILKITANEIIKNEIAFNNKKVLKLDSLSKIGFKLALDSKGNLALEVVDES